MEIDLYDEVSELSFGSLAPLQPIDDEPYQSTRIGFVIDAENRIILIE